MVDVELGGERGGQDETCEHQGVKEVDAAIVSLPPQA